MAKRSKSLSHTMSYLTGRQTTKATLPMGACSPQSTMEPPGANTADHQLYDHTFCLS